MNDPYTAKKIRLVMDLRTKGVKDLRVLGAIEKIPRDVFVPVASAIRRGRIWLCP